MSRGILRDDPGTTPRGRRARLGRSGPGLRQADHQPADVGLDVSNTRANQESEDGISLFMSDEHSSHDVNDLSGLVDELRKRRRDSGELGSLATELPPFLTVEQAGMALQLGRSKTYELTNQWERTAGRTGLPFVWFGHQKRVPRAALEVFIQDSLRPRSA